jgi:hypothetical protein
VLHTPANLAVVRVCLVACYSAQLRLVLLNISTALRA